MRTNQDHEIYNYQISTNLKYDVFGSIFNERETVKYLFDFNSQYDSK